MTASEERFRELLETVDEIFYEVDASGVLTYVNPAVEVVLGYSVAEVVGHSIWEFVVEEDRHRVEQNLGLLVSGQRTENEYRMATRSGGTRWVRTSSYPVLEDGRVTKVRGVLHDIEELKRIESELRVAGAELEQRVADRTAELEESEANLRAFFESTDDRMCTRDRDGAILLWNGSFAASIREHFGVKPYVGLRTRDLVPPQLRSGLAHTRDGLRQAFQGKTSRAEFAFPSASGETVYYEYVLSPVWSGGEVVAAAEVTRDVTERKAAQVALQKRDQLFRGYLRSSTEAIWSFEIDPPMSLELSVDAQLDYLYDHARIVVANDAWAREFGSERSEDMIGMSLGEIVPRSEPENVTTLRLLAESNYLLDGFITRDLSKSGEVRTVLNNHMPEIREGCLVRTWGTHRDITAQEADQRRLREAEQKYRMVADHTYDWECWESPDGELLYVSPACERISGYQAQEFIGNPLLLAELILDADRPNWARHYADHGSEKDPVHFRIRTKDGEIRWIEHTCSNVVGENGDSLGIRGSNRDVTARREVEEALRKEEVELARAREDARTQREMLAHANRIASMEGLASSLAHELNQPLTAILSNAQAAIRYSRAKDPDVAIIDSILLDIVSDDKRAGEIIRRLRSFVRKESTQHVPIDVNGLVGEVMAIMTSEAIIRNLTIRTELAEELPEILGDRVQLQQVLVNLITNARQAAEGLPKDRRAITLRTDVADNGDVLVEVRDLGPGLDLSKGDVFEPFFTTKSEGMGMGLSICRSLIDAHTGLIWAENAEDRGARVCFTIPAADASHGTEESDR